MTTAESGPGTRGGRRGRARAVAALLFLLCLLSAPRARALNLQFTDFSLGGLSRESLAPGMEYWALTLSAEGRLQNLHVLEVQPGTPGLRAGLGYRNMQLRGFEKTADSLSRLADVTGIAPLAAVNGDFFDMSSGGGLGLTVSEGRLLMSGEFPGSWSFGLTKDLSPRIGQPVLRLRLRASRAGREVLPETVINALNHPRADIQRHRSHPANAFQARQDNALVLYTSDYYRSTMQRDGGYEVRLKVSGPLLPNGDVTGIVEGIHGPGAVTLAGSANVPQGSALGLGYAVLSATGEAMDALRKLQPGDEVTIGAEMSADWADAVTILGGGRPDFGPLLLKDGEIQPEFPMVDDYGYFYGPNARTAAGITKGGSFFLLMAQGRLLEGGGGLSIRELSVLMRDLGAVTALNLDGGASSGMALWTADGAVQVGLPPGREGIAVGNSLMLYRDLSGGAP